MVRRDFLNGIEFTKRLEVEKSRGSDAKKKKPSHARTYHGKDVLGP